MKRVCVVAAVTLIDAASGQGMLDGLKRMAFPGAQNPGIDTPQMQQAPASTNASAEGEMDLVCLSGPQAQTWFTIQQKLRYILPPESAFGIVGKDMMEPLLMSVVEDMATIPQPGLESCGIGKLLVQILSLISQDDQGFTLGKEIKSNEPLTSPILTLLLDIPWTAYQPVWPMFGLLSQISMRRQQVNVNDAIVDGLMNQEMQQFLAALNHAVMAGDLAGLRELAGAYLQTGTDGLNESPICFMTVLFIQAATTENKDEAQELFATAQGVMKRMVHNPMDLDTTLSTKWPLWGMAYLASLKTADLAAASGEL